MGPGDLPQVLKQDRTVPGCPGAGLPAVSRLSRGIIQPPVVTENLGSLVPARGGPSSLRVTGVWEGITCHEARPGLAGTTW